VGKKLALALDIEDEKEALSLLSQLKGEKLVIKIGYLLFIKEGPALVNKIKNMGFEVFLDLKLHDIPNTVYNGVKSSAEIGADYLTIHALGGVKMMEKAVEAAAGTQLKLLAVTILTSHDEDYTRYIGSRYTLKELVLKLAKSAVESGVHGIVSSPYEVKTLKKEIEKNFISVTPGIRLEKNSQDDQKRVATPEWTVRQGADIIVVGRPIINAKDKIGLIKEIKRRINNDA